MKKVVGFTLIELIVSVAIIGILASIAYPSYTNAVSKTRRSEAMTALAKVANLQEQYYADNRTYVTDMTKLGFLADPYITDSGYYKIDSVAVIAITSDYIITATAINSQAGDSDCSTFSLDYLGVESAKKGTTDNTDNCWSK
jgi:type IV pilus assembly protein PilE